MWHLKDQQMEHSPQSSEIRLHLLRISGQKVNQPPIMAKRRKFGYTFHQYIKLQLWIYFNKSYRFTKLNRKIILQTTSSAAMMDIVKVTGM